MTEVLATFQGCMSCFWSFWHCQDKRSRIMNSFKVQLFSNKAVCKAAVAVSLSKLNSSNLMAGLGISTKFLQVSPILISFGNI